MGGLHALDVWRFSASRSGTLRLPLAASSMLQLLLTVDIDLSPLLMK